MVVNLNSSRNIIILHRRVHILSRGHLHSGRRSVSIPTRSRNTRLEDSLAVVEHQHRNAGANEEEERNGGAVSCTAGLARDIKCRVIVIFIANKVMSQTSKQNTRESCQKKVENGNSGEQGLVSTWVRHERKRQGEEEQRITENSTDDPKRFSRLDGSVAFDFIKNIVII